MGKKEMKRERERQREKEREEPERKRRKKENEVMHVRVFQCSILHALEQRKRE